MWVRMIVGFDKDGLLIPKWRDAFMLRGAFEGEFTVDEEHVEPFRRRALVARLQVAGIDVVPPLVDVTTRYAKNKMMTVSGISEEEPFNRWKAQAWRMEILSTDTQPTPTNE